MPEFEFVELSQLWKLSYQLADKIAATHPGQIDHIISINRGGAVLSRILADVLDIELGAFGLRSYTGVDQQKGIEVSQELNLTLAGKTILLVDEICDTGHTFETAVRYAQELHPARILTATLYLKPHSIFQPDFFEIKSSKWVIFPYELRETQRITTEIVKHDHEFAKNFKEYAERSGSIS
jgi:uncharacterized protein